MEFRILGPLEVLDDDRVLDLPGLRVVRFTVPPYASLRTPHYEAVVDSADGLRCERLGCTGGHGERDSRDGLPLPAALLGVERIRPVQPASVDPSVVGDAPDGAVENEVGMELLEFACPAVEGDRADFAGSANDEMTECRVGTPGVEDQVSVQ